MQFFFVRFYRFFRQRKALFFLLLTVYALLVIFLSYQLHFDEDIANILPGVKDVDKMEMVLNHSNLSDKLIVHIYTESDSVNADQLQNLAFALNKNLQENVPEELARIQLQIDESKTNELRNIVNRYPFLFMNDADYGYLDSIQQKNYLSGIFDAHIKMLNSPASFSFKEWIVKDPVNLNYRLLNNIRAFGLGENFVLNNGFISTVNGKDILFLIEPTQRMSETKQNNLLVQKLDESIAAVPLKPSEHIEYFGGMAVSVANAKQIKRDILLTVVIAMSVLLLFLSWHFRSPFVVFFIFIPVAIGALTSLSVLYLIKGSVSAIALGVGAILLGIAVDFSLHTISHFKDTRNLEKLLNDVSNPIFITSLTTACAFYCLTFLESSALRDLGLFAAISILTAAVSCLLVLPQLLDLGLKLKEQEDKSIISKLAAYPIHKNKIALIGIVVLTVFSAFFIKNVGFEDDLNRMSYVPQSLQDAENHLDELTNLKWKNVFLVTEGTTRDEALTKMEAETDKLGDLRKQEVVKQMNLPITLTPSDNEFEKRRKRWENYWTDEKKAAFKLSLNEVALNHGFKQQIVDGFLNNFFNAPQHFGQEDLSFLNDEFINDYVFEDKDKTYAIGILKVEQAKKADLYAFMKNDESVFLFDKQFLTGKIVDVINKDFNKLLWYSGIWVTILLLISFGRIELTLLSIVPMILSWILTLGVMGLFHIKFNIINVIVSTFIFGLGDDFSVFVVSGLQQEFAEGKAKLTSYKKSILLSAITTFCGIGVMIFAKHPALKSIALISLIGLFSVVVISFTIQPFLWYWFVQRRKDENKTPIELIPLINSFISFTYFPIFSIILSLLGIVFVLPLRGIKAVKYAYHWLICNFVRSLLVISALVFRRKLELQNLDKNRPSLIIANHSSFLDILEILALHPKIIMLVNKWNDKNIFYGILIKLADFYPISNGYDQASEKLQALVNEGYSIAVFPEGTRSPDGKIRRFHKGAFYLAEQLNLPVQCVLIHGLSDTLPKGDFYYSYDKSTIKTLPLIEPDDARFGTNYAERTKLISKYFKEQLQALKEEEEIPYYFRDRIIKNYIYKSPVLEWYVRIKLKLSNYFEDMNQLLPKQALVYDVGCGYGYSSLIFAFTAENRKVIGLDLDEEKIEIARNLPSLPKNIEFFSADALNFPYEKADAFVLGDVLHYLDGKSQEELLEKLLSCLNEKGLLLIRDADSDVSERHENAKWTEKWSTFLGFNKAEYGKMQFLSGAKLKTFAEKHQLHIQKISESASTSNALFVLRKS